MATNESVRSLNVCLDHCKSKDIRHAVKELLANAVDANRLGDRIPKMFLEGRTLTIEDAGTGLRNEDFVLGNTANVPGSIGSFGAGLLDAVALLKGVCTELKAVSHYSTFTFPEERRMLSLREVRSTWLLFAGTRWTITFNSCVPSAELKDLLKVKEDFLVFQKSKSEALIITPELEVYAAQGVAGSGKLFVNGMRMEGVKPLALHYNFPSEDTLHYGREHQVSNEAMNATLKKKIAAVYKKHPDRFYDALVPLSEGQIYKCDEFRWVFMKDIFEFGAERPAKTEYTPEPFKAPQIGRVPPRPPSVPLVPTPVPKAQSSKPSKPIFCKPSKPRKQAHVICGGITGVENSGRKVYICDGPAGTLGVKKGETRPRVLGLPMDKPEAVYFAMGVLAKQYSHGILHCPRHAAEGVKLACNYLDMHNIEVISHEPVHVHHLPVKEGELQELYTSNKVPSKSVQWLKEKLEKVSGGKVLLGGSLRKGVATKHSDVDMVIGMPSECNLEEVEKAVYEKFKKSDPKRHRLAKLGGHLIIINTHIGSVDVSVVTEEAAANVQEEIRWFEDAKSQYKQLRRAVVLLKVWLHRNNLKLKGLAVELLAAQACKSLGGDPGLLPILKASFKHLQSGTAIEMQTPPHNNLTEDVKWGPIKVAAARELQRGCGRM